MAGAGALNLAKGKHGAEAGKVTEKKVSFYQKKYLHDGDFTQR